MSLSEFDKLTVELVPERLMIPDTIELPQYHVEESKMRLEYRTDGKDCSIIAKLSQAKPPESQHYPYSVQKLILFSLRDKETKLIGPVRLYV